jgi:DNA-binding transcriptional LysR family regulator
MDRIEAMAAFVAVADLQGFAPAARKLGVSASAVTRLVAALEERLGAAAAANYALGNAD